MFLSLDSRLSHGLTEEKKRHVPKNKSGTASGTYCKNKYGEIGDGYSVFSVYCPLYSAFGLLRIPSIVDSISFCSECRQYLRRQSRQAKNPSALMTIILLSFLPSLTLSEFFERQLKNSLIALLEHCLVKLLLKFA